MPDGLVATAQPGDHPRVLLELTWAGAREATIVRVDPDASEIPVRNAEPAPVLGMWVGHDHEMPLDVPVSYKATSPSAVSLTDTFTRTVANGWGSPDIGGAYTTHGGVAADYSVGSGVGTIAVSATASDRGTSTDIGSPDQDIQILLETNTTPVGGSIRYGLWGRFTDANNHYRGIIAVTTGGVVTAEITARVAGTLTALATAATSLSIGTNIIVRFRCVGPRLQLKVWQATVPEPVEWTIDITEPVPSLTTGDRAGAFCRRETPNSSPTSFDFDTATGSDLAADPLTTAAVTVNSLDQVYLKHIATPTLSRPVHAQRMTPRLLPARRGVARPIDRADPIVVHQIRGLDSGGALVIQSDGEWAENLALRELLADGGPLLLQQPAILGEGNLYLSVDTVELALLDDQAGWTFRRTFALPFDVTARPPGESGGAVGATYADLDARYTDYAAQTASTRTYASLTAGP